MTTVEELLTEDKSRIDIPALKKALNIGMVLAEGFGLFGGVELGGKGARIGGIIKEAISTLDSCENKSTEEIKALMNVFAERIDAITKTIS